MAQPKIFVSYSHDDNDFAEKLVKDLNAAGANAWLDKNELGAGDFQARINKALADCEWFLLVLSRNALASPWVQQEVNAANARKHLRQIQNLIFIQAGPIRHDEIPPLWQVYNIYDAASDYQDALNHVLKDIGLRPAPSPSPILGIRGGFEHDVSRVGEHLPGHHSEPTDKLPTQAPIAPEHFPQRLADLGFLGKTAEVDGKRIEYIVPPLCDVPAGPFLMGDDEQSVTLPFYQISCHPVIVAEYACFVRAGHGEPSRWEYQVIQLDHPVVDISWNDAVAYAAWLAKLTGQLWRLPSEEEWEKAARGPDGRVYPWGDKFDQACCNTSESRTYGTTPIGTYPNGAGPYGTQDQAGNVFEWTAPTYDEPTRYRVLRGGSWYYNAEVAAGRSLVTPEEVNINLVGIRLVVADHPAA